MRARPTGSGRPTRMPRQLAPLAPPPPDRPSDYAARLAELRLPLTADPRLVKPGLHPATLGAGGGAGADAAVAAAQREADALADWGEDILDALDDDADDDALQAALDGLIATKSKRKQPAEPWWENPAGADSDDDDGSDSDDDASWQADGMEVWPLGGRGGGRRVGAGAAEPPAEVDFITGLPLAASAAGANGGAADSTTNANDAAFAGAFAVAARALRARLSAGVKAELAAARDEMRHLYSRSSTEALVADGTVLTGLAAKVATRTFDSVHFDLYVPPPQKDADGSRADPSTPLQPRSKAGTGLAASVADTDAEEDAGPSPLPYHQFSARDPIVLTRVSASDGLSPHTRRHSEDAFSPKGTVIDVSPLRVRVALSLTDAVRFAEAGRRARWRVDATVPDVTAGRQLRALMGLAAPWATLAPLGKSVATEDEATAAFEAAAAAADAEAGAGSLSKEWTPGELRVRSILLGDPAAPAAAATPPDWARLPAWRADVGAALAADDGLNESQRGAVATALTSTLTLWQGPPGTGKTRTLVALLTTLAEASRSSATPPRRGTPERAAADAAAALRARSVPALACGDTNAAADNLTLGLAEAGVRVVRLGAASKAGAAVAPFTLESLVARTPAGAEAAALRETARLKSVEARQSTERGDIATAKEARAAADTARLQANELVDAATAFILSSAEVVTCTTAGAGDARRLGATTFRSVVVDEATQATEPSTLVPLLRGAEWAVLAGDPRQLPPTVTTAEARGCGLDASLFERLMAGGLDPILLDTQYRMHPAIAAFPSARFYGGRLRDGVPSDPPPAGFPWPAPDTPVALVEADDGVEQQGSGGGGGGGSMSNAREAALALRAAAALLAGGDVQTVAILSPYSGQVRLLRGAVRGAPDDVRKAISVNTIDGFQGREADAVVISTVRSNSRGALGFVTDARRMNVALTRGRRAAIVVGAPNTLTANGDWRAWIDWVTERGALLPGGALPPVDYEPAVPEAVARYDAGWGGGGGGGGRPFDNRRGDRLPSSTDDDSWGAFDGGAWDAPADPVPAVAAAVGASGDDDDAWTVPDAGAAAWAADDFGDAAWVDNDDVF